MAFIEKAVSLGTNDTLVYECPATNSGSMHGLVFSNTSNIQVAVTIKLYQHSSGVTLDIAKDRNVSANGEFTWPKPINLADGDKIIALADVDGVVAAIASVYLVTSIVAGGPLTPRGTWSSLATYKTNDIVVHNGTSYIAVSSSTNVTPPSSAWMVLVTAFSGSYDDLTNKPSLFSGSYNDLVDKPELVVDYNDLTNKPTLFSGSYTDLTDAPDRTIIPGNAALTLPSGTTAQRPEILAAVDGMIRHNTSNTELEAFVRDAWKTFVMEDDLLVRPGRAVTVSKTPGKGQFSTIKSAVQSIDTNSLSATNQFVVRVLSGTYEEESITVPSFVHIVGEAEYAVVVHPVGTNQDLFTMQQGSTASFLRIENVTSGGRAFNLHNVGYFSLLHKVSLLNCDNGWDVLASSSDSIVYLEYCNIKSGGNTGLRVESQNGFKAYVNCENLYVYGGTTNPTFGVWASGVDTFIGIQSCSLEGVNATGTAFFVQNGAHINSRGLSVFGWDIGVHGGDSGAPPVLSLLSTSMFNNGSFDLKVEHSGTTGCFDGVADRAKVNVGAATAFSLAFTDSNAMSGGFVQTGRFYMGADAQVLTDVTDLIIETPPLGLLSGGGLQAGSGRLVNVAAGTGYLRKNGHVTRIEWGNESVEIPAGTTYYIAINDTAAVDISLSEPDQFTHVILGRAQAGASTINAVDTLAINIKSHGNQIESYLRKAVGSVYESGSIVTEHATINRAIDVTAGRWYYGTLKRNPTAKSAPYIVDAYLNTSGVLSFNIVQQIPNGTLDPGGNAGLIAMTSGYYAKHTLYQAGEGAAQQYYLAHAQDEFATLEEAELGPLVNPRISPDSTPPIAHIIVQQGNDNIVKILDARPRFFSSGSSGGSSGGTSNHSDLLNLSADDHQQYLLVNGTRAMGGSLDMGANNITNVGTVDGIDISAHASRHLPNGTDPLATGVAVSLSTSSANAVGIANSFARADHTHALDGVQASSPELTAIISQTGTGLATRTGTNTWATRQITSSSGALTISNGNGVAGNIDINYAVACTPGTYTSVTVDQYGVVTSGATSQSWSTLTGTPTTLSGYGITDSQPLNTNLNALASTSTAGFYAITGGGTSVTRSLTAPAAGITITNTDGVDGNPTFALANDLAAVEAMTGVGLSVRTATDTWASRTLTGTARVSITNGSGVSGNPIIDLAPTGTAGTYARVTTDAYGRVVSGTPMTGLAGQQMATVIAAATTTSVIAFNNSAPTSTAGALLTSITITPTSANSTFMGVIAVTVDTAVSARNVVITIFRGTTLVGMGVTNNTTTARPQSLSVTFFDAPATTSDVTYDVRIGQNLSGTTYVNTTATASFGNAAKSAFIVSETL